MDRAMRMRTPFWTDTAPPPVMGNIRPPRGAVPFLPPTQQPQRTLIGIPVGEGSAGEWGSRLFFRTLLLPEDFQKNSLSP